MIKGVLKTRGLHAIVWQISVLVERGLKQLCEQMIFTVFWFWNSEGDSQRQNSCTRDLGGKFCRVLRPWYCFDFGLASTSRAFRGHVNQCRILFLGVDGWWQRMDMCTVIFHCHVRCLDDPYEEVRHLLTRICTGQNLLPKRSANVPEPLGSMNGVEICWQLKKGKQTTQTTLNFKNLAMCARFSFGKCGVYCTLLFVIHIQLCSGLMRVVLFLYSLVCLVWERCTVEPYWVTHDSYALNRMI